MPGTRLTRFRPEHLDRVMEIERASFGRFAYPRGLFRVLERRCGDFFLVARRGAVLAGYAVACVWPGAAEIVSIAVDPRFRGRGIGKDLMRHLLAMLAAAGAKRAELMVRVDNAGAARFYRAFGFRRVRLVPGYYEDGAGGWLMSARIAPK